MPAIYATISSLLLFSVVSPRKRLIIIRSFFFFFIPMLWPLLCSDVITDSGALPGPWDCDRAGCGRNIEENSAVSVCEIWSWCGIYCSMQIINAPGGRHDRWIEGGGGYHRRTIREKWRRKKTVETNAGRDTVLNIQSGSLPLSLIAFSFVWTNRWQLCISNWHKQAFRWRWCISDLERLYSRFSG